MAWRIEFKLEAIAIIFSPRITSVMTSVYSAQLLKPTIPLSHGNSSTYKKQLELGYMG